MTADGIIITTCLIIIGIILTNASTKAVEYLERIEYWLHREQALKSKDSSAFLKMRKQKYEKQYITIPETLEEE